MRGERKLEIQSAPDALKFLWEQGFFSSKRGFVDIKNEIEKLSCFPTDSAIHHALKDADFLTRHGVKGNFLYAQASSSKVHRTNDILPQKLEATLLKQFGEEISDLKLVYGRSGTCTAFMLRKILEKLLFLSFAKQGHSDKLKIGNEFIGLSAMLDLAQSTKVNGTPFLMPKTAKEIAGIKFLGDTSAHNPLVNVEMETIVPSMPFIITAYDELSKQL